MIKIALSGVLCATLATASTTMCFIKDHTDPSNIELTPLEGGECKGMFTVQDMKKQGYDVGDIKITTGNNGMNYMYVFNKQTVIIGNANTKAAPGTQVLTKEQLRSYLTELKEEEELAAKRKEEMGNITLGKEVYTSTCATCHGKNAELSAYNKSRPLNTLTYEEIGKAIAEYDLDMRSGSTAIIMKPYAANLTKEKLKGVAAYIKTLK